MSDKLYAVYESGGKVKLVSTEIVKETKLTVRTAPHENYETNSAFQYKTLFNKGRSDIHRTPQEAIDAFIRDQQHTITGAQQEIGDARRSIMEAQKLYSIGPASEGAQR